MLEVFIAGKYKGKYVEKIKQIDPQYVKFIKVNHPHLIRYIGKPKLHHPEDESYGYKSKAIKPNLNFDNETNKK